MPDTPSTPAHELLERFFTAPNRLTLDACRPDSGKNASKFAPWLDRLRGEPKTTVLPRWNGGTEFIWYGIAFNEADLRRLGEDLFSFVGPTWSTFRGQRAELDTSDPIEEMLLRITGGFVFKLTSPNRPEEIWDALERLRIAWSIRPLVTIDTPRPIGRVMRDFFIALRAGDRESAELHLAHLERRGAFDALNRLFLRIQLLSELNADHELLQLPSLPDVLRARRPVAVSEAIIRAIYRVEISTFEEAADALQAVNRFRAEILPRYGSLYTGHSGMRAPEAIKSFMLLAASSPPDYALRSELLDQKPLSGKDAQFLRQIAELIPARAPEVLNPTNVLAEASGALQGAEFGRAFTLALPLAPSIQRTQLLCQIAFEMPSLEAERAAADAIFGLGESDREAALRFRTVRDLLDRVTGNVAQHGQQPSAEQLVPGDWIAWLKLVYREPTSAKVRELARRGASEWTIAELLQVPDAMGQLTGLLADAPSGVDLVLADSLPHLVAFFQRDDEWPRRDFASVYRGLLDLLVLTTNGGKDDLNLYNELLSGLLSIGVSGTAYEEILIDAVSLCDSYGSPTLFDWMLELLELLCQFPCPAAAPRTKLLNSIDVVFARWARRIRSDQRWLLDQLHTDLGEGETFRNLLAPETPAREESTGRESQDPFTSLSGKSVAVYTLNDRAAQAVQRFLENQVANVTVHLSNDHAGNNRLRDLARQSDYFVMSLGSAKHAATGFIEAHRPVGKPLIRTAKRSKGSAGLLAALARHLEMAS